MPNPTVPTKNKQIPINAIEMHSPSSVLTLIRRRYDPERVFDLQRATHLKSQQKKNNSLTLVEILQLCTAGRKHPIQAP